ncbi:type II secretion system protein [Enterococcus ureasiticus]|uniref:competence type IV pilus minor pilin ComGE n=1 Tax=Enterococcus ureasiticus TaxID=903984 RepID=UPI001A8D31E5|nr:competence type IV pilus minor pilin ComGE [Enterococcus ureasiticus]MBO0474338.1 type II secretion system protein [Enterococcus ureasiticus]
MLKKSNNYNGYILLESLIALGLLCLIIGSYVSLNTFLLKKNKQVTNQLLLHRVLYEKMKHYENHGGALIQDIHIENRNYQLRFYKTENKLIEVEIIDEKESFTIKKE